MQLNSTSIADRARRRIMRRLMPYLFGLFVIAYLDRVNVSYAALQMKSELSFTDEVLGFGAGIFFWGYFLLEIPGTILVEKWSARRWIARIMISWGIVAMLMGFVHTKNEFYLLRFLLGVCEAGFFPGIIVYLSHWFLHCQHSVWLYFLVAHDHQKTIRLLQPARESDFCRALLRRPHCNTRSRMVVRQN